MSRHFYLCFSPSDSYRDRLSNGNQTLHNGDNTVSKDQRDLLRINAHEGENEGDEAERANNGGMKRAQLNKAQINGQTTFSNEQTTIVELGGEKVRVVYEEGKVILLGLDNQEEAVEEMAATKDIKTGVQVLKLAKKNITLSEQVSSSKLMLCLMW